MTKPHIIAATLVIAFSGSVFAQEHVPTLRAGTPLGELADPAQIAKRINSDLRQVRNYPEQPPLIQHKIEGY